MIALSIVFLATEIVKNRRDTLTWRFPIAVSGSFGLIHGLGFAAVLKDIGLPQVELYTGLLFFNIGVEVGQALFVGVIYSVFLGIRKMVTHLASADHLASLCRNAGGYFIGGLSSFWLFERLVL